MRRLGSTTERPTCISIPHEPIRSPTSSSKLLHPAHRLSRLRLAAFLSNSAQKRGSSCHPATPAALAQALVTYLSDPQLRAQSGAKAAEDAAERFDSKRHAAAYLEWYAEIVEERKRHVPAPATASTSSWRTRDV